MKKTALLLSLLFSSSVYAELSIQNAGSAVGASISGGDSNGIMYVNSSGQLDTSSVFIYDGAGKFTSSRSDGYSSGIDYVNGLTWSVNPGATGVAFGGYNTIVGTGSATASGGHVGGFLGRITMSTETYIPGIGVEGRCDTFTGNGGQCIGTLGLAAYTSGRSTGSITEMIGLQTKPQAFDADGTTAISTGVLIGLDFVAPTGGAIGSRIGIRQPSGGVYDYNIITASTNFSATQAAPSFGARLQIVQAGGAGLNPAFSWFSGAAGSYVFQAKGRTGFDAYDVIAGAANDFATGSAAGDEIIATNSTGSKIFISAGINAVSELVIGNGYAMVNSTTASLGGLRVAPPAAQTIGAGGTIAADACGTIKLVTAAGGVTTDTTNTFTAPASANYGCCMVVRNSGAQTITLDRNGNFLTITAADLSLTAGSNVEVCSDGVDWFQVSALATPS